jgi:hypothetical protein
MVTVSLGTNKKTFKSIREAAAYAGISYMTMYMRLRMGTPAVKAIKQPVMKYERKDK